MVQDRDRPPHCSMEEEESSGSSGSESGESSESEMDPRAAKVNDVAELRASLDRALAELGVKNGVIEDLKTQLVSKDSAIRELQLQLDKFHSVMKPLTEQLTQNLILSSRQTSPPLSGADEKSPGARPKRLAISAEPVDVRLGEGKINKVPKSDQ